MQECGFLNSVVTRDNLEAEVRKYAISALGKIRDERVLDPLLLQLRNDEFKDDAIDALVALGAPSVEKLIPALRDKDENVRKCAVIALGRIKHSEAIDPLIQMLSDKDWFTRLTAAAALESIGDERGRHAITPLLKDPDMVVRMRVERILAKWKKPPVSQPAWSPDGAWLVFPARDGLYRIDLASGGITEYSGHRDDFLLHLIDTGPETQTGGRLLRLGEHLRDGTFLMTYGDGVADIDIKALAAFHRRHGKAATVTAVQPPGRFGQVGRGADLQAG